MEGLVNLNSFAGIYSGKTVLVTGHTGFKGAWLSLWLKLLGARVIGYSLQPPTQPALFEELRLSNELKHVFGDIRDLNGLKDVLASSQPEIVFHLAAQPLVRLSYEQPVDTFSTNIMGTVNLLEAVRSVSSVRACVLVTSDKCYENKEWPYAYRENDSMGGYDPYSASKGCSELVAASMRSSYFPPSSYDKHRVAIATARAGNVIGGGDWALDRIFPDAIRALSQKIAVPVRNPFSIRPWQHVLEPLSGYLWLAARMFESGSDFAEAWNFGPLTSSAVNVKSIVEKIISVWGGGDINDLSSGQTSAPHEANFLRLDCSKATGKLGWQPVFSVDEAIEYAAKWYRGYYCSDRFNARDFSESQIFSYTERAASLSVSWAKHSGS